MEGGKKIIFRILNRNISPKEYRFLSGMKDIRTSQGSYNLVSLGDIHWFVETKAQNVPHKAQNYIRVEICPQTSSTV